MLKELRFVTLFVFANAYCVPDDVPFYDMTLNYLERSLTFPNVAIRNYFNESSNLYHVEFHRGECILQSRIYDIFGLMRVIFYENCDKVADVLYTTNAYIPHKTSSKHFTENCSYTVHYKDDDTPEYTIANCAEQMCDCVKYQEDCTTRRTAPFQVFLTETICKLYGSRGLCDSKK